MNIKSINPITITKNAIRKIKNLILMENKNNLRIYIVGGGCSGFQYEFKLDDQKKKTDLIFQISGINIIIDAISWQYLVGGKLDYIENLRGSKFIIKNPNAKTTCGCGLSFSI